MPFPSLALLTLSLYLTVHLTSFALQHSIVTSCQHSFFYLVFLWHEATEILYGWCS